MKIKNKTFITALALPLICISGSALANAVVTPPLTKCHIEVDNPHLSRNLFKARGIRAVKVNARSTCNKPIRNLVLTVEIYKVGFLRNHLVASEIVKAGDVLPNRLYKNEETYSECKSSTESRYYGVAYAEADIEGRHLKTLHVTSEKTNKIKCGN